MGSGNESDFLLLIVANNIHYHVKNVYKKDYKCSRCSSNEDALEMEVKKTSLIAAVIVLASIFHLALMIFPENVKGATLCVGGTGPRNYTSIQSAIDDANPGDIIYVYEGTYHEHLTVSRTLSLTGEGMDRTIVDGSGREGVVNIVANWVNLSSLTITNGSSGSWFDPAISLSGVRNCHISNITVSDSYNGMAFSEANNNTIVDNVIQSINASGVFLHESENIVVSSNTFLNNGYGISLYSSKRIILRNNSMNKGGIHIYGYTVDNWNTHDIDTSNIIDGKAIYYWKDVIGGTVPSDAGQVILANCTEALVEKQSISNVSIGILIGHSSNNTISDNTVLRGSIGFLQSSYNNITNNSGDNCSIGFGDLSNRNTIINNTVRNADYAAFSIYSSHGNLLAKNVLLNNGYGVYASYATGNVVSGNYIASGNFGVYFKHSTNNVIANNTVMDNSNGISLPHSFHWIGGPCEDNLIYHNNLINNSLQAVDEGYNQWDNGYSTGGNYWGDYTGSDSKSGPDQKQEGSDGVGDIPYYISMRSWNGETEVIEDEYPLMSPLETPPYPPGNQPPICTITTPVPSGNVSGIFRLSGNAADFDGTVEKVEIRIDNNPWVQATGTTSWSHDLDTKTVSNGNHTIHVRSYDGTSYSAETYLTIFVDNPASEELEQDWFWTAVAATMILVTVILLVAYFLTRKKNGKNGKNRSEPPPEEDVEIRF